MRPFWRFMTDFGEIGLLLPCSLALCTLLWLHGARHAVKWFVLCWSGCLGLLLVGKLLLIPCTMHWDLALRSPSGHAGASLFFYGALGWLLLRHAPRSVGWPTALLAVLLMLGVPLSRVMLGMHSVAEVVAGVCVGLGWLTLFARREYGTPRPRLRPAALGIGLLAVSALASGAPHVPAELAIRDAAHWLQSAFSSCRLIP